MRKWLKWIIVGAVVLVVVVVAAVWLGLDYAAKKGVEVGGKAALGVDTDVESVHIGVFSSSVSLNGFRLGNPEGYNTDRLMALGQGKVACKVTSLLGDEVQVREILIDQPELTIEFRSILPPKNNLGDLLAKLESDQDAPPTTEEEPEEGKKFRVDLIRVTKAKVRFHLIGGQTADVTLPDIELKDVKNADGTPLMLADLFGQVLASMGTSAFDRAKGVLPDDLLKSFGTSLAGAQKLLGDTTTQLKQTAAKLQKDFGKAAEELKEAAGKITGELGKATEGLGKEAGKVTKGVGDAVKGIFGGKRKDKEDD